MHCWGVLCVLCLCLVLSFFFIRPFPVFADRPLVVPMCWQGPIGQASFSILSRGHFLLVQRILICPLPAECMTPGPSYMPDSYRWFRVTHNLTSLFFCFQAHKSYDSSEPYESLGLPNN